MDKSVLLGIPNYRQLTDLVATAGQPSEDELVAVAHAGFVVVLNLGLHDAQYSLPDERKTVESLCMRYVHIPVAWECPLRSDLERFIEAMDQFTGKKLFIHCAANKRVSVFMALYRQLRQGWTSDAAISEVHTIWDLNDVWRNYLKEMIE
ncbi:MAG: protein tyrosine phosphatase family protein [Sulfuricaulis sp.]